MAKASKKKKKPSGPPIGIIVGGIVGGVAVLAVIVAGLFFAFRPKRNAVVSSWPPAGIPGANPGAGMPGANLASSLPPEFSSGVKKYRTKTTLLKTTAGLPEDFELNIALNDQLHGFSFLPNSSRKLELEAWLRCKANLSSKNIVAAGLLTGESAESGGGRPLTLNSPDPLFASNVGLSPSDTIGIDHGGRPSEQNSVILGRLFLEVPGSETEPIKKISGTFTYVTGRKVKRVEIADVRAAMKSPVTDADLVAAGLAFQSERVPYLGNEGIRISVKPEFLLSELIVFDATGNKRGFGREHGTAPNNQLIRSYDSFEKKNTDLPAVFGFKADLWTDLKQETVPFVFEKIRLPRKIPENEFGAVISVAFSPDGTKLAAGGDKLVSLWSTETGEKLGELDGHEFQVTRLQFNEDGNRLVTGSVDKNVILWNVQTGSIIKKLPLNGPVEAFYLFRDGKRLAACDGNKVVLRNIETGEQIRSYEFEGDGHVNTLNVSEDETRLVCMPFLTESASIWDVDSGNLIKTIGPHDSWIQSVHLNRDGSRLLVGQGNIFYLWNTETEEVVHEFEVATGYIHLRDVSADFKRLIAGSRDGGLTLRDIESGDIVRTFNDDSGPFMSARFNRDGTRLATGSLDGASILWNADTGEKILAFEE